MGVVGGLLSYKKFSACNLPVVPAKKNINCAADNNWPGFCLLLLFTAQFTGEGMAD